MWLVERCIDFYGTGIEFWAGFGPVGITEKKIGLNMSNFRGRFFMFSWEKNQKLKSFMKCS